MTFEKLKIAIDKKRIMKNSKWEWVYDELLKCESEFVDKQKVKDAIMIRIRDCDLLLKKEKRIDAHNHLILLKHELNRLLKELGLDK